MMGPLERFVRYVFFAVVTVPFLVALGIVLGAWTHAQVTP